MTIGGVTYTIVQFEVPRFDSDEVYLLKFPAAEADLTATYSYQRVDASGAYPGDAAGFVPIRVTTLSGFNTLIGESFNFSSTLTNDSSGRRVQNAFSQGIGASILLGPETRISLHFGSRRLSGENTDPVSSADASNLTTVYPPTRVRRHRPITRQQLRNVLSYVSLRKKP